jgi:hypothetical protein
VQFDEVMAILEALQQENVDYVLVEGVAVGLHGFERATNDVDLFVRPTEDNVMRLRSALRRVFDDPSIDDIHAEDLAGEFPTIRYGPPEADFYVDILGRLGSAIAYDDLQAQDLDVAGVRVRLATPETLYRMKRDTVRPIDRIDAEVLKEAFRLKDVD